MKIKGFIKTSFMDWDGKIVSVLFLPGCTFRCPFCHNSELAIKPEEIETLPWEGIKDYLIENKDFLDGVCITGGEPTLTKELPELCKEIKEIGLQVKLDTNGTNPEMLKSLISEKLVDYIAMDVKAPFHKYKALCGTDNKQLVDAVKESIKIILQGETDYEFRTTIVPTLLAFEDVQEITKQIKGAKKYVIQNFIPDHAFDTSLRQEHAFSKEAIQEFIIEAKNNLDNVTFRGKV